MPVSSALTADKNRLDINISGRFDFSMHREFRDSYRHHDGVKTIVVNLSRADYMDSSALGMLLLLKEYAGEKHATVELSAPSPAIKKILTIANFDKLFKIN
jgi:anti-anti-sigma factor